MWALCGAVSVLFLILGFVLAVNKNQKSVYAAASSLAFAALTMLMEYRMILNWVSKEDWSALLDVVPSTFTILCGYVILMFLANSVVIALSRKNRLFPTKTPIQLLMIDLSSPKML